MNIYNPKLKLKIKRYSTYRYISPIPKLIVNDLSCFIYRAQTRDKKKTIQWSKSKFVAAIRIWLSVPYRKLPTNGPKILRNKFTRDTHSTIFKAWFMPDIIFALDNYFIIMEYVCMCCMYYTYVVRATIYNII